MAHLSSPKRNVRKSRPPTPTMALDDLFYHDQDSSSPIKIDIAALRALAPSSIAIDPNTDYQPEPYHDAINPYHPTLNDIHSHLKRPAAETYEAVIIARWEYLARYQHENILAAVIGDAFRKSGHGCSMKELSVAVTQFWNLFKVEFKHMENMNLDNQIWGLPDVPEEVTALVVRRLRECVEDINARNSLNLLSVNDLVSEHSHELKKRLVMVAICQYGGVEAFARVLENNGGVLTLYDSPAVLSEVTNAKRGIVEAVTGKMKKITAVTMDERDFRIW
jgi:hypothetical protein